MHTEPLMNLTPRADRNSLPAKREYMFVKRFVLVVGPGRQLRFLDMYQRGFVIDHALTYAEAVKKLNESTVLDIVLLEGGPHRAGVKDFCEQVRLIRPSAKIVLLSDNGVESGISHDLMLGTAIKEEDLTTHFKTLLNS